MKRYFGALTSKNLNYTFNGRKWEIDIFRTIFFRDPFFPYIHLERRGQKLLRVLPVIGSQEFLDNRIRFFGIQKQSLYKFNNNIFYNFYKNFKTKNFFCLFKSFFTIFEIENNNYCIYLIQLNQINAIIIKNLNKTKKEFLTLFLDTSINYQKNIKFIHVNLYYNNLNFEKVNLLFQNYQENFNILQQKKNYMFNNFFFDCFHENKHINKIYKFTTKISKNINNVLSNVYSLGYFYDFNFYVDKTKTLRFHDTSIFVKNLIRPNNKNLIIYLEKLNLSTIKIKS